MTEITENILIEHGFKKINEITFENDLFFVHKNFRSDADAHMGWRIHLQKPPVYTFLLPRHIQYFDQLQSLYKLLTQKEL